MKQKSNWIQVLVCLSMFTILLFIGELLLKGHEVLHTLNYAIMALLFVTAIGFTINEMKEETYHE